MARLPLVVVSLLVVSLVSVLDAATVPGTIVVQEGDIIDGAPVTIINAPFTNGDGEVGFTGAVDRGGTTDNFVWSNDGVIWFNSDALTVALTGAEGTMGIGNGDTYIYSPSVDTEDAVWTHNGVLLVDGDPAPDFPGQFNSFNSRPTMLPNGTAYWVAGVADTTPGGVSIGRVLYRSADTATPVIEKVIAFGDMIDGLLVDDGSGIDFDYNVSDDDSHLIQVVNVDTGSTSNDGRLLVDGVVVAREDEALTEGGESWDNFDTLSINNDGNFLFSGDTTGSTATDEFIAYNGAIVIREGDMIAGVTLTSSATVNGLSINNLGQAIYIWNTADSEILFFASDASDLAGSSTVLLQVGDELDTDGDGIGEFLVDDFNASGTLGPGLDLAEDNRVFVELDLADIVEGGTVEAIIELDMGSIFMDGFESGDTSAWSSTVN
ncbi:MAG: hypothetical protein AAGD38_08055 [Acidobacteriota bacterium]